MRSRAAIALGLLAVMLSAGCVELEPAHVPDRLIEGQGGNGWEKDLEASQTDPDSAAGGTAQSQTLVYEDKNSERGYPGTLTITTLRTLLRPTEGKVATVVQERIRTEAEERGLRIDAGPIQGSRTLANGATSRWFVYNGSVQATGSLFQSRDSRVKIYGEVFSCAESKGVVVAVGLAQVNEVRRVGGVPLPGEEDATTWKEIVSDPRGAIESARGSDGLVYNVVC